MGTEPKGAEIQCWNCQYDVKNPCNYFDIFIKLYFDIKTRDSIKNPSTAKKGGSRVSMFLLKTGDKRFAISHVGSCSPTIT